MAADDLILWTTDRPKEPCKKSEEGESSERSRSEYLQGLQQEPEQELPQIAASSSSTSSPKGALSPSSAAPPALVSMDPLSMLRHQRVQGGTDSSTSASKPSAASRPPFSQGGRGKSDLGIGEPHKGNPLFDVESSLGMYSSSRAELGGGDVVGENADTAMRRIECALAPGSNVDFPTITDIGDRIAHVPAEMGEAVALLAKTFSSSRAHPRRRLKALTIMHELAYDPLVAKELRRIPYVRSAFQELRAIRGTELGEAAEEQIRMFATELSRKLEDAEAVDTPLSPSNRGSEAFDVKAFGNGVKVYASGLFAAAVDGFSDVVGKMQEQTFAAAPFLAVAAEGCSTGVTHSQGGGAADELGIPQRRDLPGGPVDASFPRSATEYPRVVLSPSSSKTCPPS